MKTWVETDEQGNVIRSYQGSNVIPPPTAREVTGDALVGALSVDRQRQVRLSRARLQRKPRVVLRASARRVEAGVGEITVEIVEGPDEVPILVGRQEATVTRAEPLVVTSRTAGTVVIRLNDPSLYMDREMRVFFFDTGPD